MIAPRPLEGRVIERPAYRPAPDFASWVTLNALTLKRYWDELRRIDSAICDDDYDFFQRVQWDLWRLLRTA